MERTISVMLGKGSVNHNSRKFQAKNVDGERSPANIDYCNESIKKVYHELFDDALKAFNEKQTRADRRIDNYYEKIRNSKQEKPFHEIILYIGDKYNMGAETENGELSKTILNEYYTNFQKRNPQLRVFSAHLHMDEATPHLHIDFVPFTTGSKRGLETRVSLKQALSAQGFKGGTRSETEWNQWVQSEKEQLAAVMERHGIEWEHKGLHEKHLSVYEYEKKMRAAEVVRLGEIIDEKNDEIEVVKERLENYELGEKSLADVQEMLDNNPDYILPEPTALMSAKSYKQKIVEPMFKKLKDLMQMFILKFFNLKDSVAELHSDLRHLRYSNNELKEANKELTAENAGLREDSRDYKLLRKVFGDQQIDDLLAQASEMQASKQREKRFRNNDYER